MVARGFSELKDAVNVDIAIVGAGVSGLYCAWRLLDSDPHIRVVVVERLNRTGGRLDTDLIGIGDRVVREEEGGMRFNYGMMELMKLVNKLGLCEQIVPFPMSSAGNTNRFFVRGHAFTAAQAAESGNELWAELYDLDPAERGLSPTDLVTNAYRNVLYANGANYESGRDPLFWAEFRTTFKWNGVLLRDWLMWGLLRDMGYSQECIEMLSETIGFAGPFKALANAGDAFQILADFPKDPTYFTFRDGYSTLPNAIVSDLENRHGDRVQIVLSTNVDSISLDGDSFRLSATEALEFTRRPSIPRGKAKTIRANRLFLAVATKGAEDLLVRSPAFTGDPSTFDRLWDAVHGSVGMPLMKINLYYDLPWWENGQTNRPPVQFGPNFTDLPVNAVYPFYAEPFRQALVKGSSSAVEGSIPDAPAALTIYCDFDNTNFWHGLQGVGPLFASELQDVETDRRPQVLFAASEAVVVEARHQLQLLFDATWVPEPVLTSYRLWNGQDDFEFAYHQWRQGVDDRQARDYLSQPVARVHFCNEAISDMQGWVNGSLRSCDAALRHVGIAPLSGNPCTEPETSPESARPVRARGLWGA